MIDRSIAANDNERLALSLLGSWEDDTLLTALNELCTDDFVWANSGLPTLRGRDEIIAFLASGRLGELVPILETMTSFSADVRHIASRGNIVFTERVDHHWDADGCDLMTPHIAGVIEIRGDRVSALRDFYDTVCYQQRPTKRTALPGA